MANDEWVTRRPVSNIMDYASPTDDDEPAASLARMPSQSHNNRFYSTRPVKATSSRIRPRPITTPTGSMSDIPTMPIAIPSHPNVIPGNTLPSAPASPPTPAPSPTPMRRAPDWSTASPSEDIGEVDLDDMSGAGTSRASTTTGSAVTRGGHGFGYRHMRAMFAEMDNEERQRMLAELLNMCDGKLLGFVAGFVGPRLKRDPFSVLPNELCLRILTFVEDPRTLARSSQVSRRWRELVSDDMAWKSLCEKHAYRRLSDDPPQHPGARPIPQAHAYGMEHRSQQHQQYQPTQLQQPQPSHPYGFNHGLVHFHNPALAGLSSSAPDLTRRASMSNASLLPPTLTARASSSAIKRRPQAISYRSHFKQRYQVETAWRTGGKVDTRQITPDQGVVTSLHLTDKYIIVALDNAKIHVFDTDGRHLRCLQGHVMGVWAMVPCGDILVSGGCDRDVRVWDLNTGMAVHMLRGHTSTVRCLKMSGSNIAISGSRDTTLRVWDIKKGVCKHVLIGHQASVRCLEIHGDLVVSGSYDTTARIWSISDGRCLRTLQGHFSQIYAVAFDGRRVATGSLDTSVRVWDPRDGRCLAQLQGHTSLVGQLQLRGDTLVTGGSDGSVRVWSLHTYGAIHRLAAHDNSVTSLQFDDGRIVSGGSDGRVKVWDLHRGTLVRELGSPAEAVWRVVFEEEKAVVLASRGGKTVMEVWSFAPPPEDDLLSSSFFSSPSSSPYLRSATPVLTSSSSLISPYQDPAYGEPPSYPSTEAQAAERDERKRVIRAARAIAEAEKTELMTKDNCVEEAGTATEQSEQQLSSSHDDEVMTDAFESGLEPGYRDDEGDGHEVEDADAPVEEDQMQHDAVMGQEDE